MRITIFVLIIFLSGLIGYEIKRKYVEQKEFLLFVRDILNFIHLHISIYKNNINEILINYKIKQNNKNAKYVKIFQNNNNLQLFDLEIVNKYIYDSELKLRITTFFCELGKGDLSSECLKIKSTLSYVDDYIERTKDDVKTKGDLWFKICLAVGVVVVIIMW